MGVAGRGASEGAALLIRWHLVLIGRLGEGLARDEELDRCYNPLLCPQQVRHDELGRDRVKGCVESLQLRAPDQQVVASLQGHPASACKAALGFVDSPEVLARERVPRPAL